MVTGGKFGFRTETEVRQGEDDTDAAVQGTAFGSLGGSHRVGLTFARRRQRDTAGKQRLDRSSHRGRATPGQVHVVRGGTCVVRLAHDLQGPCTTGSLDICRSLHQRSLRLGGQGGRVGGEQDVRGELDTDLIGVSPCGHRPLQIREPGS